MTITCLNCYWKGDSLEEYHRHNLTHDIDEGVSFKSAVKRKVVAK